MKGQNGQKVHLFPGLDTGSVPYVDRSPVQVGQLAAPVDHPPPVVLGLPHDVVVGEAEHVELGHGGEDVVDALLVQLVVREIQYRELGAPGQLCHVLCGVQLVTETNKCLLLTPAEP